MHVSLRHQSCSRPLALSFFLVVRPVLAFVLMSLLVWQSPGTFQPLPVNAALDASGSARVSASVPDTVAPSTPVLIAPADASSLTDSTPSFVWSASTDNVGVTAYALWLDGTLALDGLPVAAAETTSYVLSYDSTLQRYTLTPKQSLANGSHTWKITARDAAGNTTSSTTWSFLIDTQAPTFVVTAVGTLTAAISAQDISTIPASPLRLADNEPVLSGTGEGGSAVKLTLRRQGSTEVVETLTFTIASAGTWSVTLPVLERNQTYLLTFQITDRVGLLSVLDALPLLIEPYDIEVPLPTGWWPPIDEPIVIPIGQLPYEVFSRTVHTIQIMVKDLLLTAAKAVLPPEMIARLTAAMSPSTRILSPLWYTHLLVLLAISVLPILKHWLVLRPFGKRLSFQLVAALWAAVFGYPARRKASVVVDAADLDSQAYLLAELKALQPDGSSDPTRPPYLFFTDRDGFLPPLPQVDGLYCLSLTRSGLPVAFAKSRPAHLQWQDWYQGQPFTLSVDKPAEPIIIPVSLEGLSATDQHPARRRTWILRRPLHNWPTLVLVAVLVIITPTLGNFFMAAIYGAGWLVHSWRRHRTNVTLEVVTPNKQPVPSAIIRLKPDGGALLDAASAPNPPTRHYTATLYPTNKDGKALIALKSGRYHCLPVHPSYRPKNPSLVTIDATVDMQQALLVTPLLP